MSTLTPNYGLHLPENTDSMDDFFTNYESDMTTIDGNLGGGGGATIEEMTQAEYEALPDTKKTDGILRGLKDVKSFLDADILYLGTCYSTSERMVGCWVDGKPLYQKTFNITPSSSNFNIDVSSLNIETMVSRFGSFTRLTNGVTQQKPIEYRTESANYNSYGISCAVINSDLSVSIESYPYTEILNLRVTVQYTKTTDVAGSGTWTPSGVNAVHYDTNEQIIGTYLGKPLYQKTITFDTGVIASNIDYDITSEMPANCEVVNDSFVMTYTYDGHDYRNANINGGYYQDNTSHYFHFSIGGAQYNKHVELTIQYTKTTD